MNICRGQNFEILSVIIKKIYIVTINIIQITIPSVSIIELWRIIAYNRLC